MSVNSKNCPDGYYRGCDYLGCEGLYSFKTTRNWDGCPHKKVETVTDKVIAKCKECKRKKELTIHGTCWRCHLGTVSFNDRIEARKKAEGEQKERIQDYKIIEA